jgi:hypothetical protein
MRSSHVPNRCRARGCPLLKSLRRQTTPERSRAAMLFIRTEDSETDLAPPGRRFPFQDSENS